MALLAIAVGILEIKYFSHEAKQFPAAKKFGLFVGIITIALGVLLGFLGLYYANN